MTDDCLSVLELLDLRDEATDRPPEVLSHVANCPRCAALMRVLPTLVYVHPPVAPELHVGTVVQTEEPGRIEAGQVWRAIAPNQPDRSHVVIVLGQRRGREDGVVVAPTSTRLENATELDLVVEASTLPYRFMACPWNFGVVFPNQLEEYLGSLSGEVLRDLVALYRFTLAGDPIVGELSVGPTALASEDDRLTWRAEQLNTIKPLYEPWSSRLHDRDEDVATQAGDRLSAVVLAAMDAQGHDNASLAEAAHVSRSSVDDLCAERLDLTDQTDIDAVGAILGELALSFERIERPLISSLHAQSGGLRVGLRPTDRLAARRRPGVSAEHANELMRADLSEVDDSPAARERAVADYVRAVADRLE
ncbi:MAG: hypothetical protein ACREA0_03850 [bacterium]